MLEELFCEPTNAKLMSIVLWWSSKYVGSNWNPNSSVGFKFAANSALLDETFFLPLFLLPLPLPLLLFELLSSRSHMRTSVWINCWFCKNINLLITKENKIILVSQNQWESDVIKGTFLVLYYRTTTPPYHRITMSCHVSCTHWTTYTYTTCAPYYQHLQKAFLLHSKYQNNSKTNK